MSDVSWLMQHRFNSVVKNEFNWDFVFSDRVTLRAECLWRLLDSGRIVVTSEDHGHKFGLPSPVNCVEEFCRRIAGAEVASISLREGTLDLAISFSNGCTLELIPTSSGYEAWHLG